MPELTGYLGRGVQLSCLCAEDAQTCWLKDGEELAQKEEEEEMGYLIYRRDGENVLEISRLEAGDSGQYSCKIVKFGKEGEDTTSTWLNVIGNNTEHIDIAVSLILKYSQISLTSLSRPCRRHSTSRRRTCSS